MATETIKLLNEKTGYAHAKAIAAQTTAEYAFQMSVVACLDRLKKQI